MKLLLLACLTLSAAAALSTIRSGPRKQLFNEGYEFGRPAIDLADVENAFQEMQFIHIRSLQGDSYGNASLQNPGMGSLQNSGLGSLQNSGLGSLQNPGMGSLQNPGMGSFQTFPPTIPAITMSMDSPAQSMATSPPSTITKSSMCVPPDLTNSSSVDIAFNLEVETLIGGTAFVEDFAQSVVSSLAALFSLCLPSGKRKLVARNVEESKVTGLEVSDKTGIAEKTCIATTNGASCEVFNVVLTAFSDEDSSEEAGRRVYDEVIEQLENGEMLKKHLDNDDIVAIRIQQNDSTIDKAVDTGDESSGSAWTGTTFKATVSVLSILAVSVVAVGVYRNIPNRRGGASSDGSVAASCDSSIVTGDNTAQQTVLTEDTPNPV